MRRPSSSRGHLDPSRTSAHVTADNTSDMDDISSSDGGDGDIPSPDSPNITPKEYASRRMSYRAPSRSTTSSLSASLRLPNGQNESQAELLHKGYKAIYHPHDPNRPSPEIDSDCSSETYRRAEKEAKLMSEVISLSSDESSASAGSSFSSHSGRSEDSQDCKDPDRKIKEKGFDVIRTRDLSPRSKQRRRTSTAEQKALNKGLDELKKSFRPTSSYLSESKGR